MFSLSVSGIGCCTVWPILKCCGRLGWTKSLLSHDFTSSALSLIRTISQILSSAKFVSTLHHELPDLALCKSSSFEDLLHYTYSSHWKGISVLKLIKSSTKNLLLFDNKNLS
jgi:hypothetical protein